MSDYICFLITIFYTANETAVQCAIKVKRDELVGDCAEYPMEPENKELIQSLLPYSMCDLGPIIKVERIFEVHCV